MSVETVVPTGSMGVQHRLGPLHLWLLVVGAVALVFPLVDRNPYLIGIAILIWIYAIVAQCWNLVMAIAGIWSFAQLAIFAVGAYANTLLQLRMHMPSLLAFVAGGLVALLAGMLIGFPSIRLRGIYVVLFTLAFQESLRILISSDDSGLTKGTFGLYGVNAFGFMNYTAWQTGTIYYYFALGILVAASIVVYKTINSPTGLALRALRDSEAYAVARGISRVRYQVTVFAISSLLTGLAGALYADYFNAIGPTILGFDQIALLLAMMVIGGWGTFAGPTIGAIVVIAVSERLHDIEDWRLLIFGAWMVLMIVFLPSGLVGLRDWATQASARVSRVINKWMEG